MIDKIRDRLLMIAERRPFDFCVGPRHNPSMKRWYVIPRNRLLNIYLHHVRRDDPDKELHDHPWHSVSWLLEGRLREVTFAEDWSERGQWIEAGSVVFRTANLAHRLEVADGGAWTLFITGPRFREWGFWCLDGKLPRWLHWEKFTKPGERGVVGRGCGE